jgi:hypothetical protein
MVWEAAYDVISRQARDNIRWLGEEWLCDELVESMPAECERLEAGEFASVRQAALEAGIVKPTFTCPIDPERAARLIRKHFEPSAVDSLIDALQGKATP